MTDTYKIVRHYHKLPLAHEPRVIKRGLTIAEARAYCQREETARPGVWFDTYERER